MSETSVYDVRVALNEISEEELSDSAIQQKIDDGKFVADSHGLSGYERKKFVRSYAALKSFAVSNTYSRVSFGDISVSKNWDRILDQLRNDIEEVIDGHIGLVIDSTPMFDDRPMDTCRRDDSEELEEEEI